MIRALHNATQTYSGMSNNTEWKQQRNLNYVLESTKKHPYIHLSQNLK